LVVVQGEVRRVCAGGGCQESCVSYFFLFLSFYYLFLFLSLALSCSSLSFLFVFFFFFFFFFFCLFVFIFCLFWGGGRYVPVDGELISACLLAPFYVTAHSGIFVFSVGNGGL